MRVLERRLRRLEEGFLPPAETAASRRVYEMLLNIRRRRAERRGLPVAEEVSEPGWGGGMSFGEMILASRQRVSERQAAEQAGARG
jgi:hypothetical protein